MIVVVVAGTPMAEPVQMQVAQRLEVQLHPRQHHEIVDVFAFELKNLLEA